MSISSDRGAGWTAAKRLDGKVAVVIGAGQSPGEGMGNGRAAAIRLVSCLYRGVRKSHEIGPDFRLYARVVCAVAWCRL